MRCRRNSLLVLIAIYSLSLVAWRGELAQAQAPATTTDVGVDLSQPGKKANPDQFGMRAMSRSTSAARLRRGTARRVPN